MSETLDQRAELLKLARLLGVEQGELAGLQQLPSAELRQLREQVTDRLFAVGLLGRVGVAARAIPSGLVATIAERAFGPLLCARAAGSVDPGKAIDVAGRLPAAFLADTAVELDPRRVAPIIAGVPPDLVVGVARILGEREEYVTMGRFLAFVPDSAIAAAIGVLSDEAMLRTAFVLEHKDRLDHAVGLLPPDRLPGIIACAAAGDLWPEALELVGQLSDERRAPIADVFAMQDADVIAGLVAAVSDAGIWELLLPIVRLMSRDALRRLATVPAFHERGILAAIIDAAATPGTGLWADLAPLLAELPPATQRMAAEVVAELDPGRLGTIVTEAAGSPELIGPVLASLTAAMPRESMVQLLSEAAAIPGTVTTLVSVLRGVDPSQVDQLAAEILPLLEPLPPELAEIHAQLQREGLLR